MKTKTLKEVRSELRVINSDIRSLQSRQRELRVEELRLRNEDQGLVPYETMIREIKQYGDEEGKPGRLGQFVKYYTRYRQSDWVIVLLVNKDGKVGLRERTFYKWQKEA